MSVSMKDTFKLYGRLTASDTELLLDLNAAAHSFFAESGSVTEICGGFIEEDFLEDEINQLATVANGNGKLALFVRGWIAEVQAKLQAAHQSAEYAAGKLEELEEAMEELENQIPD